MTLAHLVSPTEAQYAAYVWVIQTKSLKSYAGKVPSLVCKVFDESSK
ncbi:hypothetical protein WN944_003187 [Citrus x changshan-huyou]|uniref:Uncharacterized protein n=1 Tax=Citrus x changshan-huyou TaxID=2935761 RepID=A0AAP0QGJ6_9ROSI